MCGIAAIFNYRTGEPIDSSELTTIRDAMAARGPDGHGNWFTPDGRVGLGHRRLAIIDLSPTGAHPCKIYNILNVAAPILYIGPRPSHLSELLDSLDHEYPFGTAAHGDVARVVEEIERMRHQSSTAIRRPPARMRATFSKETLLPRLVEELEAG